jgi:hypothetical protein
MITLLILLLLEKSITSVNSITVSDYYQQRQKNMQIFSYVKMKQTDCGVVQLNEDYNFETLTKNDDNIGASFYKNFEDLTKSSSHNNNNNKLPRIIANLTACLKETNQLYSSFSVHLTSNLAKNLFQRYFHLDEETGIVYLIRGLDREVLFYSINY